MAELADAYDSGSYERKFLRVQVPSLVFKIKNQMTIDDLMQDTYMKAIDNLKSYKIGTNFYAWISIIARNTAINYYNKNYGLKVFEELLEDVDIEM